MKPVGRDEIQQFGFRFSGIVRDIDSGIRTKRDRIGDGVTGRILAGMVGDDPAGSDGLGSRCLAVSRQTKSGKIA